MKPTLLALALAVAVIPVTAQAQVQPFEVGYQWSLSGKQYAFVSQPLRPIGPLSFDAVGGYEINAVSPSLGFGFSYKLEDTSGFYLKAGAFMLFPQQAKPDLGFGLTFGVEF